MVSSAARPTVFARDLARKHRAHGAVHVADRQLEFHRRLLIDGILA
jgi:hypothetical protein